MIKDTSDFQHWSRTNDVVILVEKLVKNSKEH